MPSRLSNSYSNGIFVIYKPFVTNVHGLINDFVYSMILRHPTTHPNNHEIGDTPTSTFLHTNLVGSTRVASHQPTAGPPSIVYNNTVISARTYYCFFHFSGTFFKSFSKWGPLSLVCFGAKNMGAQIYLMCSY